MYNKSAQISYLQQTHETATLPTTTGLWFLSKVASLEPPQDTWKKDTCFHEMDGKNLWSIECHPVWTVLLLYSVMLCYGATMNSL